MSLEKSHALFLECIHTPTALRRSIRYLQRMVLLMYTKVQTHTPYRTDCISVFKPVQIEKQR